MFEFLKKLFEENPHERDEVVSGMTAPDTRIHYHDQLINELVDEHHRLLSLFGRIAHAAETSEHEQLPDMLHEFALELRSHLLKENIKLYVYLQHALADDPESRELMRGFRSEMNEIGKTVNQFLNRYGGDGWNDESKQSFATDVEAMGKVLAKRIETEEKMLYPLYMPPEAYH